MADGFTDLEEKIMAILAKERKTASHLIADAHEIAGLVDLQLEEARKAWADVKDWVGCDDRSSTEAEAEIRSQVEAMERALAIKRKEDVCEVPIYDGTQACQLPKPCDIHDRHLQS